MNVSSTVVLDELKGLGLIDLDDFQLLVAPQISNDYELVQSKL